MAAQVLTRKVKNSIVGFDTLSQMHSKDVLTRYRSNYLSSHCLVGSEKHSNNSNIINFDRCKISNLKKESDQANGDLLSKANSDSIVIDYAINNANTGILIPLNKSKLEDFCCPRSYSFFGHIDGSNEQFLVGMVEIQIIEAENAKMANSKFTLEKLFQSADSSRLVDFLRNEELDGEAAESMTELCHMLNIPNAEGNIILFHNVHVHPSLIGKGVGTKIIKEMFNKITRLSGVLLLPVSLFLGNTKNQDDSRSLDELTESFKNRLNLSSHPYRKGMLCGSIDHIK